MARWLGVDVGAVRVGVAVSDPDALLATPVETIAHDQEHFRDLTRVVEIAHEFAVGGIALGLPRHLNGSEGEAACRARRYAQALAKLVPGIEVRLVDERLTTVGATRQLHDSGVPGRRHRAVIDQAAAVLILQAALDAIRAGRAPGEAVTGRRRPRRKGAVHE